MKKINGKQVKITNAGYLYIDGVKVWDKKITPLQTPTTTVTGDTKITEYAHDWAFKNYKMV